MIKKLSDCDKIVSHIKNKTNIFVLFDKDNSVKFYVNDKIFAILYKNKGVEMLSIRLKPELNNIIREHKYILASTDYMNSFHWSTIFVKGVSDKLTKELIDISYNLSIKKMNKKQKIKYEKNINFGIGNPFI